MTNKTIAIWAIAIGTGNPPVVVRSAFAIATGAKSPERTEQIPVTHL
ncbi:hypothetical protein [Oscillatoria nigro-viridis]|nr:hypothetical protein [Oscillatoria nigro-viridis]